MFLVWFRAIVGFLLMLNFSLPLAVLLEDFSVPEEPMLFLILNLTLACYLLGSSVFMTGVVDVIYSVAAPLPLCASLLYVIVGATITGKTAYLLLALDQYIAIVHPLHHQTIMNTWKNRMVTISWCFLPIMCTFGFVAYQLDLETSAEFSLRTFGVHANDECRLAKISEAVLLTMEMGVLLLSSSSAALYIYTAIQGMKQERRNAQRGEVDETSFFFLRFKSFKRIVKIILCLLVIDMVGSVLRISSRWYQQQTVLQAVHLFRLQSIIIEGWTYGLRYPDFHSAFRRFFRMA